MDSRDDIRLRAYAAEKRVAELEAKLERYEKALEFYTQNEVWQLNGACDSNSGNFSGTTVAINALLEGEQDG